MKESVNRTQYTVLVRTIERNLEITPRQTRVLIRTKSKIGNQMQINYDPKKNLKSRGEEDSKIDTDLHSGITEYTPKGSLQVQKHRDRKLRHTQTPRRLEP